MSVRILRGRRRGCGRDLLKLLGLLVGGAGLNCGFAAAVATRSGDVPIKESGFELSILDERISQPWLKTVGDLNGDGAPDLVVGGASGGGLVAYLNQFPVWVRTPIETARRYSTDGEIQDVNGDGRADVIALTRGPDELVWIEQGAAEGWSMHRIQEGTWHDVEVADLNGDSLPDLVARNQKEWPHGEDAGNRLFLAYQHRRANEVTWTFEALECPEGEGLVAFDLDRDGDSDLVINEVWFENREGRGWEPHRYADPGDAFHPNTFVAVGDLDGDGQMDIIVSPSERKGAHSAVYWFGAPEGRRRNPWVPHVLSAGVETVLHFAGAADFDGDGRTDVITAEMPQGSDPDEVVIHLNRGAAKDGQWRERWQPLVISRAGSHSMRIVDVDGDGRPDLFGANWSAQGQDEQVKLWLNRLKAPP